MGDRLSRPSRTPRAGMVQLSVSDLIRGCNDAMQKMGNGNPHKILIFNCAAALRQLVDRLDKLENPEGRPH